MIYLIVQKWSNTKNNHAGMYHLAKLLTHKSPETYKLISIPDFKLTNVGIIPSLYNFLLPNIFFCTSYFFVSIRLLFRIKSTDSVVLFEYLTPGIRQDFIANVLRFFKHDDIRIYGFVHLVPSILRSCFSDLKLSSRLQVLSGVFTFGSSLQFFLNNFSKNPVYTFFHYSDLEYYKPSIKFSPRKRLNILVIGQQARNYSTLTELVSSVKCADFKIVVSDVKLVRSLEEFPNVMIFRHIAENELLDIMQNCDCCLGYYDDIVGSNVLSNCISVGIIPIVKDVGSVRDYLSSDEAFICSDVSHFKTVLDHLIQNPIVLNSMRDALLGKSQMLNWENFHFELQRIICS